MQNDLQSYAKSKCVSNAKMEEIQSAENKGIDDIHFLTMYKNKGTDDLQFDVVQFLQVMVRGNNLAE